MTNVYYFTKYINCSGVMDLSPQSLSTSPPWCWSTRFSSLLRALFCLMGIPSSLSHLTKSCCVLPLTPLHPSTLLAARYSFCYFFKGFIQLVCTVGAKVLNVNRQLGDALLFQVFSKRSYITQFSSFTLWNVISCQETIRGDLLAGIPIPFLPQ